MVRFMPRLVMPSASSSFSWRRKRVHKDSKGQVSFAVVAVLLLTLAGASAIIGSQASLKENEAASRRVTLEEMARCFSLIAPDVEEEAYRIGIAACEEAGSSNGTLLESRFQELLDSKLAQSYPRFKGSLKAEVLSHSLHMDLLRLAQGDEVSSTSEEDFRWGLECPPAYFTLDGNFSLKVSNGADHLICSHDVERHIYIPSPLLLDRIDDFQGSVAGGASRLENLVRYELSSLAQWRALSGWGSKTPWGQCDASSLIGEDDVRRALGLGLIMVELECFGSFDLVSADEVLREFPSPISAETLSEELEGVTGFDPSDIFLALYGAKEIDIRKVLAQALYSTFDVLGLRWLDYLHVIDLGEAIEDISVGTVVALNDILERLTGDDNLQEASAQWMLERLDASGVSEMDYRWMNYGSQDAVALIPHRSIILRDYQGEGFTADPGGYQVLDFPSLDVLDQEVWKDFLMQYRQGTFRLAEIMQNMIASLCFQIAEDCSIEPRRMALDPSDGLSMNEEANDLIMTELASCDDWFAGDVEIAVTEAPSRDPLGQSLVDYVGSQWEVIFDMQAAVESAIDKMAERMVREAFVGQGITDESLIGSYSESVAYDMMNDASWGVRQAVEEAFSINALNCVDILTDVFGNLQIEGADGPLSEALVKLAQGSIEGMPGAKWALVDACNNMLEDISVASDMRGDEVWVEPAMHRIGLFLEGGAMATEVLSPKMSMPWFEDSSILQIQLPSTSDSGGLHLTDPRNASFAAYQDLIEVQVRGSINLTLGCEGDLSDLLAISRARISCEVPITFDASFTCSSAWPLQGVDYSPTKTIFGAIGSAFVELWKTLSEPLGWLASVASDLFEHLQDLVDDLIAFASAAIQELSDLLMAVVQQARDMIDGAIGSLIGWMERIIENLTGSLSLSLRFAGLTFLFDFSPKDFFLGRSKDYLRVTVIANLFGAQMAISARFVDIYRQGPDIITNLTLSDRDWRAECVIDPRMMVMDHFVEIKGIFKDFILEANLPEVVAYDERSIRLSDIPGLGQALSRIPIPIPGLTAAIDMGFEVKYDSPFATNVVINEVELNPPGVDRAREWVELYNPSNSPVDLTGWSMRTAHGDQAFASVGDSTIGPKSYLVVGFSGQSLDNGGESGFPLGESMALIDSEGKKVDSIPFMSDHYNDDRSWQRTFDGSDRWEFKDSTRNAPNGLLLVNYNDVEQWERCIVDTVTRSFAMLGKMELSIDSLAEMIKSAIYNVVDFVLQTLADSLLEMSVFLEVALQDYSQSLAGRFRLSLAITGDGVKDALLWIADSIRTTLVNFLNPSAIATRSHCIHEIMDDIYIRFGVFGTASLPKIISSSASDKRFSFGASIELNLACLVSNSEGRRNWTMNFGVLFEGVPGALLRTLSPIDSDQLVDVWLLRASLRSLRPEDAMSM